MRLHPDQETFSHIVKTFLRGIYKKSFYLQDNTKFSLLFSDEGIFELNQKGLFQLVYSESSDDCLTMFNTKTTALLTDNSYYRKNYFKAGKLPLNIVEKNYHLFRFKTCPKSPVFFHIVQEESGMITEAWFEVPDSMITNPSIVEDVNTFLQC